MSEDGAEHLQEIAIRFHPHAWVTDTHDWLASLWLVGRKITTPPFMRAWTILLSWAPGHRGTSEFLINKTGCVLGLDMTKKSKKLCCGPCCYRTRGNFSVLTASPYLCHWLFEHIPISVRTALPKVFNPLNITYLLKIRAHRPLSCQWP